MDLRAPGAATHPPTHQLILAVDFGESSAGSEVKQRFESLPKKSASATDVRCVSSGVA